MQTLDISSCMNMADDSAIAAILNMSQLHTLSINGGYMPSTCLLALCSQPITGTGHLYPSSSTIRLLNPRTSSSSCSAVVVRPGSGVAYFTPLASLARLELNKWGYHQQLDTSVLAYLQSSRPELTIVHDQHQSGVGGL